MKKVNSLIVSVALVAVLCHFMTGNIFSQTSDSIHKTEIPEAKEDTPINESGYVKGITPTRAIGLVEVVLAIASIVVALKARKRAKLGISNNGQKGAKIAFLLGLIVIVSSIIHLSITAGAVFGSGSGKAGSIFAIILSLVGIILGRLVLQQKKA